MMSPEITISPEIIYSEVFTTQKLASGHTANDYSIWKSKILFIFANKGIDYVLHTTQPPGDEIPTNQWTRDDAIAQSLICRALVDGFVLPYYKLDTTKSIMDYLEKLYNYGPPLIQHRINVFRSYMNRRMDETTSISKHVLEMRAAVHELEMAGIKVPDEMQAVVLMNSLPESWSDVAYLLNLQLKENELGFDNVSQRLRVAAEMRPRRVAGGNNPGFKGYCCLCRQLGHNLLNCPEDEKTKQNCDSIDFPFMEEMNIYEANYQRQKTSQKLNYTGTNFFMWKAMLFHLLRGLGLDYILEQPKPPEPTDSTQEQDVISYNKWLADDKSCRHLILGAMEDNDLFLAFKNQPTAKALMDELNAWFDFPSLGRRMALFRQYVGWHMSDCTEINNHEYHMNRTVKELKRAGIDVPDEIQAVVLITSLPRSWEDIRLPMTFRIDEETKKGGKLLDIVTKRVRDAGNVRALTERSNSNANYHGNSNKKKGYERRY